MIWMSFFDRNSFVSQYHFKAQLNELNDKMEYYENEILDVREDHRALFSDQESIDRFAREKYWIASGVPSQ